MSCCADNKAVAAPLLSEPKEVKKVEYKSLEVEKNEAPRKKKVRASGIPPSETIQGDFDDIEVGHEDSCFGLCTLSEELERRQS